MTRTGRSSRLLVAALVCASAAACGREGGRGGPERAAAPKNAEAPAPPGAATAAAPAAAATPSPEMLAAMEERRLISEYTLTDKTLDGIIGVEKDLKDYWADPVQARKIRGEKSVPKILAAIDQAPRVKDAIAAHGLTPRDYILGSFSTIAAYIWEKARALDPKKVANQKPPVTDATLAVVQRRMADVTKLLSPPADRTKPARPTRNMGREDD